MIKISKDEVQHLAQLSNLQLDDDEIQSLQEDISNILGYVDQLSELDTAGVEPTYQVTDLQNIWRDDVIIDEDNIKAKLINLAPDSLAGQVKVPKVL